MEKRRNLHFTRAKSQHAGDRGLLAQAPAQHSHPRAESSRGQLARLPLNPQQVTPKAIEGGAGRGGEKGPQPRPPPRLTPEALHEALQEA